MKIDSIKRYFLKKAAWHYLRHVGREYQRQLPSVAAFSNDLITASIAVNGMHELAELQAVRSICNWRGQCVVDVGANIGNHTVFFSREAGRVIAIEPNPRALRLLRVNAEECAHVTIVPAGASDRTSTGKAYSPEFNLGGTMLVHDDDPRGTVDFHLDTLDNMLEAAGVGPVALIKLDVEGHELEALQGAARVIERHRPMIWIEVNDATVPGIGDRLWSHLSAFGYRYYYGIERCEWRVSEELPRGLKWAARIGEALLFGVPSEEARIVQIRSLSGRDREVVICSTAPVRAEG